MIPKILHFTVPREPTRPQADAIRAAKDLHPDWQVIVWQDPVDPTGFALAKLWPRANSGAQLADLIRIEAVHRHGGVYIDSDVLLRKPLDPLVENYTFFVASEDGVRATNAVFGAVPRHPALEAMIRTIERSPPDWSLEPSITTGPEFFSRILKWRGDTTILPRETFYPHNWNERVGSPRPCTYGVHQWAGSWKKSMAFRTTGGGLSRLGERARRRLVRTGLHLYRSNESAIRFLAPRIYAYPGGGTIQRKTIHGHTIVLDASDLSITPEVVQNGYYELREELFLRRYLRGGDYFLDVGANVGVFALLAASLVGPFGRVFAFEPNPRPAELMAKSATMNWVHDRLTVRRVAVGRRAGTAQLRFSPVRAGDATIGANDSGCFAQTTEFVGNIEAMTVPVVSLDEEFPVDIPLKMLKIDAEGSETQVLAGARRLFAHRCIQYAMLEVVQEVAGDSWEELLVAIESVCELGYQTFALGKNGKLTATTLQEIAHGRGLTTRMLVLGAKES